MVSESIQPSQARYLLHLTACEGEASLYLFALEKPVEITAEIALMQVTLSGGNGIGKLDIGMLDYDTATSTLRSELSYSNKTIPGDTPALFSVIRQPEQDSIVMFIQIVGAGSEDNPAEVWIDNIVVKSIPSL
jgi:hypothetical protein